MEVRETLWPLSILVVLSTVVDDLRRPRWQSVSTPTPDNRAGSPEVGLALWSVAPSPDQSRRQTRGARSPAATCSARTLWISHGVSASTWKLEWWMPAVPQKHISALVADMPVRRNEPHQPVGKCHRHRDQRRGEAQLLSCHRSFRNP
jgi:hypothetical protein